MAAVGRVGCGRKLNQFAYLEPGKVKKITEHCGNMVPNAKMSYVSAQALSKEELFRKRKKSALVEMT